MNAQQYHLCVGLTKPRETCKHLRRYAGFRVKYQACRGMYLDVKARRRAFTSRNGTRRSKDTESGRRRTTGVAGGEDGGDGVGGGGGGGERETKEAGVLI